MTSTGTKPFPVVRIQDPAIDHSAIDLKAFLASRDPSLLKYHQGEKPTVYHCRPLTREEIREVRNKASDADKYEGAFVRGLVRVDALEMPDGSVRDWVKPDDYSGKSKPIPDAELERCFSEADIQEVGMVIWLRSFLAKSSAGTFPLLPMSQSAAVANMYRRAERMSVSASSQESKQPQEAQQAEALTPSHDSAESTAAIATA